MIGLLAVPLAVIAGGVSANVEPAVTLKVTGVAAPLHSAATLSGQLSTGAVLVVSTGATSETFRPERPPL